MLALNMSSYVIYLTNIAYKLHQGILLDTKDNSKATIYFYLSESSIRRRHLKIVVTIMKIFLSFL